MLFSVTHSQAYRYLRVDITKIKMLHDYVCVLCGFMHCETASGGSRWNREEEGEILPPFKNITVNSPKIKSLYNSINKCII